MGSLHKPRPEPAEPRSLEKRDGVQGYLPCGVRGISPDKDIGTCRPCAARGFWVEKEGTYGQSERRYQFLDKAVEPPAEARPDLAVMMEFCNKLFKALDREREGKKLFNFKNSEDVWNEISHCSKGQPTISWG